jgi:hypothetical protein
MNVKGLKLWELQKQVKTLRGNRGRPEPFPTAPRPTVSRREAILGRHKLRTEE